MNTILMILLDVLILPKYCILLYRWSVNLPGWNISPRTLLKQYSGHGNDKA